MSKYKKPVEVSISQSCELGYVPVGKQSQFPFTIFNPNAKPLKYQFKYTQFVISPATGVLLPNSYSNFRIQFKTQEASVIVGVVVLQVQGEEQRVFKLSVVGKYAYISSNISEVDFGSTLVTKRISKQITLKNNSEVAAQFSIHKKGNILDFNDSFFSFSPNEGQIPAKMSFMVKINYQSSFVDSFSADQYEIQCGSKAIKGNTSQINVKGNSSRFNVSFSTSSINFGETKLDTTVTKVLTITNESELETDFEFYTDPHNIFFFNQIRGTLSRNTYKKIIIQFRPKNTISYYQRVYCLVRNHILLYIDLIGTCYDLLIKPLPLMQVHINHFRKRVIEGRISAIELKYIQNNLLLKMSKKAEDQNNESQGQNFYVSNIQFKENPLALHRQLFLQNQNSQLININSDYLDFGFCEMMTISSQRQIEVTNKLQCKLQINWIQQKKENFNGQFMTVFQIHPESAVLKPNTPTKFSISFRPLKNNYYYFQCLQFYATKHNSKVSKKTLEDFQYKQLKAKPESTLLRTVKLNQTLQTKIKDEIQNTEILPTLAGSVRCAGHSFNSSSLPFLPIMKISPNIITFKPCQKGQSVYSSVQFVNESDTPIFYKIGGDIHKVFRVFPKMGLIQSKGFAIIALQFTPREYKLYKSSLSITLNDMPGSNMKLNLCGICTEPDLHLQNNGQIYFAPTYTGVTTKKQYTVTNLSKTKSMFRIQVPEKYHQQLLFEPKQQQIEANQQFKINVYFIPQQKRTYKINVPILVTETAQEQNQQIGYHNPGSAKDQSLFAQSTKKYNLEVYGEGSDGSISVSEQSIDFSTVKISEHKTKFLKLKNASNCSFFIDLHFKNNRFESNYTPPTESQIYSVFNLDFKEGLLPANSEITIGISFTPQEVQVYDLKLIINARQKIPKHTGIKFKNSEPCSKCEVLILAEGNYPLMEIIDIRNDTLSVAALWENFSISKINQQLGCKLDSNQKKYLSVQSLTFVQARQLQFNLKHFQWNLGYVSTKNKAKPRKVLITVKNYGGTPLDYSFKFPSDNKIDEELWADPGEPSAEEAYQKAILDNKIFQIIPKIGHLEPNEIKDIELIYSPVSLETVKLPGSSNELHFLKVVFQIKNGKSLIFNLKGTTLGPNEGLLTVKKLLYTLPPTPIGLVHPLKFPIQLNNVGSIKVNYKTEIKFEEGEFPQVFRIQNPNHFLLSGQNHYIYCLFKPLIKKNYKFTIFVHVYDFNKQIQVIQLKVEGQGTDNTQPIAKKQISRLIPGQRTTVSEIGSKVFFSIEEIDFEYMHPEQVKYRLVILYNMSKQNTLAFDFPTQSSNNAAKQGLTCEDKFLIQPYQGSLEPGKFIELKVTLTSGETTSYYQGQIPCHITWAAAKYSSEDGNITQRDVLMSPQKQSLFLRIKKRSIMGVSPFKFDLKNKSDPKNSVLGCVFEEIFNNALNNSEIDDLLTKLEKERLDVVELLNDKPSVGIGMDQSANGHVEAKKDYSNYQHLLLNDQFLDVAEIIIENTFFNIIQETTHNENDFLKVGKKFIQANKLPG